MIRHDVGKSVKHRKLKAVDPSMSSVITSYLPNILLDTLGPHPERRPPWIDAIEGSLLLADISGFTRMSEQLAEAGKEGAEWLTNIINHYFLSMLDIARKYGGDNLKFGGDALLVFFKGDHHAIRAVTTARLMQQATQRLTTFRVGPYRIRLRMTVGVHSGNFWSAVAGVPAQQMQHFILGPGTGLVAKTQALATAGELVISQSTLDLVSKYCLVESRGEAFRILRLFKQAIGLTSKEGDTFPTAVIARELLAYLPPYMAQAINDGEPVKLVEGEHRKVSIIFINLLGIDELLEKQGPSALLNELQQYTSFLVQLLERYGGFLSGNDIYTNGIKLIVIFGAPVAHEQDSINALRLSLELNQELAGMGLHLKHRIGINEGFVFSGNVGPDYRRQYTVMGDAVNLAARLMSAASSGEILLTKQVAKGAGQALVFRDLPPIQVKGKKEPIAICALESTQARTPAGSTGPTNALLGREAEVESFQRLCREVEKGHGRTVLVSGEAGMGKSRLSLEFQDHLRRRKWTLYYGVCYPHTATKPFEPWLHVLHTFFDIQPTETTERKTDKVLGLIKSLTPGYMEVACLLNPLLGLSIPSSDVVRSLNNEERRRHLFELISSFLTTSSAGSPVAIFIEDLHWVDSSSLLLINTLSNSAKSARLLMCFTCRPDMEGSLQLPPDASLTMEIGELSHDAARRIIQTTLGRTELPNHVIDAILAKSRGNPLFLEEVAHSLRDSGALDRIIATPSQQFSREMASLDIPDRIQGLIMSRIDTLNTASKEILRTASVIGNTFELTTLRPLVEPGRKRTTLDVQLDNLEQLDLINHVEALTYRFKHALIQEVAYNSLLFARRRQLHHRVAVHLEEMHRKQLEPFYEVLVHHYTESQDDAKTRYYAYRAANKASMVFAHEEAIEYYRRGLGTLYGKDLKLTRDRGYLLEKIGDCYETAGYHAEAARNYSQAVRHWAKALSQLPVLKITPSDFDDGQPAKIKKAVLQQKIAAAYERNCDFDLALRHLKVARLQLPPRNSLQAAKIAITECLTLFRKGKYQDSAIAGYTGLILSRRSGDRSSIAYASNILALVHIDLGNIKRAIRYGKSALELYDTLGNLSGQAEANNNLGVCFQSRGDQKQALYHFDLSLALCERIGNFTNIAIAHNNVGEVLLVMDRLDEAINHFQKVVKTYEEKGDPVGCCGVAFVNLARAYHRKDDYPTAFTCVERGIELLRKTGVRGFLAEAELEKAELLLATSQTDLAFDLGQKVLKDSRELGIKYVQARGLRVLGLIEMARGQLKQSQDNLQQSISLAANLHADYEQGLALLSLAGLYARMMENKRSRKSCRSALNQAVAIFQSVGAEAYLRQARQMQLELML